MRNQNSTKITDHQSNLTDPLNSGKHVTNFDAFSMPSLFLSFFWFPDVSFSVKISDLLKGRL